MASTSPASSVCAGERLSAQDIILFGGALSTAAEAMRARNGDESS